MKEFLNYQDDLSKLSKKDLEYLFVLLKDYKLQYRKNLGLDTFASFGLELEFEHVLLRYVEKEFSKYPYCYSWFVHFDKSCGYEIDGFEIGGEATSPIMHDEEADWKMLTNVIAILLKLRCRITKRTSLHVHAGVQIFQEDIKNVVRFIKVWCIFEHVIFKFGYGTDRTNRPGILYFAHPIADALKLKCKYIPNFLENLLVPYGLGFDKKWAVSFKNYQELSSKEIMGNDIEFRIANGTLNRIIIQNTVNFYLKLMQYVTSDRYDEDLINHLFERLHPKDFSKYDGIYAKDALMLVDLIFDNNLDKINFLKQYVKKDENVFIR